MFGWVSKELLINCHIRGYEHFWEPPVFGEGRDDSLFSPVTVMSGKRHALEPNRSYDVGLERAPSKDVFNIL